MQPILNNIALAEKKLYLVRVCYLDANCQYLCSLGFLLYLFDYLLLN